jgi:hypothetical protein
MAAASAGEQDARALLDEISEALGQLQSAEAVSSLLPN